MLLQLRQRREGTNEWVVEQRNYENNMMTAQCRGILGTAVTTTDCHATIASTGSTTAVLAVYSIAVVSAYLSVVHGWLSVATC